MQRFVVHLFISVAVCGFVVAAWALTSGSFAELSDIAGNPTLSRKLGFWPIWVILAAGAALLVDLGFVVAGVFGDRGRKKRRQRERRRQRQIERTKRAGTQVGDALAEVLRSLAARQRERKQPAPGPVKRWVAVMFSDIVDSTRLAEEVGDDEWTDVVSRYREFVRAAFATRGGEEVGTQGDGFLAQFPSPADAVLCAVDIQRDVRDVAAAGLGLRLRIGVHAGEAVHDDGDLIGRVVNLAARVTGEAEPGEILVTEPVADYVGGRLHLEDRGLRDLRGVPQARHLLAVDWSDSDQPAAPRSGG
ncbi:MAG TPA: adenylate/guanylate cyclase domain-containing protein [Acidimicrobiia bacterium]|nr:adenylate/guanylate cyclase domain-containing protein [Acidimicrobiia bacterium]